MTIRLFLRRTWERAMSSLKLFPLSYLLITIAAGFVLYQIWGESLSEEMQNFLERILPTLWVVLPVFSAVALFKMRKWLLLIGALLGLGFYWFLPEPGEMSFAILTMLWIIALYGSFFFLPAWKKDNNNGFWQFAGRMSFIVCLGFAVSLVLMLSLQLALYSLEVLFDLAIDWRWQETVWMLGFSFVWPTLVHAALPLDWMSLNKFKEYPSFLRPFSFYLLTPISVLYFVILTVYVLKILISREWPSGEVAYPTLFFSLTIFVSYFLSFPWQKGWQRYGFLVILPFLAVYFFSLYQRIAQYGVTELRYMGVWLGVILFGLSLYYFFSSRKRFQVFFASFSLVAFVFSMGPLGVFEVSLASQKDRLETLLTEAGALENGQLKVVEDTALVTEYESDISGVVEFFASRERMDVLEEWTSLDLSNNSDYEGKAQMFMNAIGMEYNYWDDPLFEQSRFDYSVNHLSTFDVSGYDLLIGTDLSRNQWNRGDVEMWTLSYSVNSGEKNFSASLGEDGNITVTYEGAEDLVLPLGDFIYDLKSQTINDAWNMSHGEMSLVSENDYLKIKIYFDNLNGTFDDEGAIDEIYLYGRLLVSFK